MAVCCRTAGDDAVLIEQAVEHFSRMLFLERLRTPQDRQHLLDVYQGCWGHPLPLLSIPELCITPECVKLGLATLPRTQAETDTSAGKQVWGRRCLREHMAFLHVPVYWRRGWIMLSV